MESVKEALLNRHFKKVYNHFFDDSLRRNSSFLILSSAIGAVFGFLFWLICAHLTTSSQIGYATSLMAYVTLFNVIITLGLPNTLIRFLPRHNHEDQYIITATFITIISSILIGIPLIESISLFSPSLKFAITNHVIFGLLTLTVISGSLSAIAHSALMAKRDAKRVFIKSLWPNIFSIIFPFLFFQLNLTSIITIFALTNIMGTVIQYYYIYKYHYKLDKINFSTLSNTYIFTFGNYTGSFFNILASTLIPIIVLNRLGPSLAAYYYLAMKFSNTLSIISSSNSQAFLAEASNDNDHSLNNGHLLNSFKNLFTLLLPALVAVILFGSQILRFYGNEYYVHGMPVLIILSISNIFIGICSLGDSLLNIQKRPFAYGLMNFINAAMVIGIVYGLSDKGLIFVGFGWLIAQFITVLFYFSSQYRFIKILILKYI